MAENIEIPNDSVCKANMEYSCCDRNPCTSDFCCRSHVRTCCDSQSKRSLSAENELSNIVSPKNIKVNDQNDVKVLNKNAGNDAASNTNGNTIRDELKIEGKEQEATSSVFVHCSEHESNLQNNALENEEAFKDAIHDLVTWLEKGERNKRLCGYFYSMIQHINAHVERLEREKTRLDDELNIAESLLQERVCGISMQLNKVAELSELVNRKKTLNGMIQNTLNIVKVPFEVVVDKFVEDEKESASVNSRPEVTDETLQALKDRVASAKETLAALREKKDAIKKEKESNIRKFKLLEHQQRQIFFSSGAERDRLRRVKEELLSLEQNYHIEDDDEQNFAHNLEQRSKSADVTEEDVYLLCLVTIFLTVHRVRTNICDICRYLQNTFPNTSEAYVENLMLKFPNIFEKKLYAPNGFLQQSWSLTDYNRFTS